MKEIYTEEKQKNKKRKKNKIQILVLIVFFVAVFSGMTLYFSSYSIEHQTTLISNSYNPRQKILAKTNIRGTIYSRDKEVLVSSDYKDNGVEVRDYKYGNLFSHVVGFAVNGKMGIERDYNYYLINSNASLAVKSEADLQGKKRPGDSIVTTLDLDVQKAAYDALGQYKGAVIATDPKTGQILAMVSKPDFDPALVAENWDSYLNDNESGVLVNRVTNGIYAPGSTFKILTSIEYIREYPEEFENYKFNCKGSIKKGEDTIRCYHGMVHGEVDFAKSFAKSCNCSFVNIGMELDKNSFGEFLNSMLFNSNLPGDFNSSVSKLVVNDSIPEDDMVQVCIGQGIANITPLHLNLITCAIANNGILYEPYVVDSVESVNGTEVKKFKPKTYGRLLQEDECKIIKSLMGGVVSDGTATKLSGRPYLAAGKTGSAEFGDVKGESHAWFTGYAIMDKENPEEEEPVPDICVTVIIEGGGSGGDYAAPIAKRVFDAYYGISYE